MAKPRKYVYDIKLVKEYPCVICAQFVDGEWVCRLRRATSQCISDIDANGGQLMDFMRNDKPTDIGNVPREV
jgi:hypothetical protein